MSFTKTLLRATTLIAALGGSIAAAHAAPMLYAEAANNTTGQMIALSQSSSSTGSLTASGSTTSGGVTASVSIGSNGASLSNGGLSTVTLDALSNTASQQVDIIVTQTGLTAAQASIPFMVSFTANALTGGSVGSVIFSDYISKTNAIFDTSSADLLRTVTLSANGTVATDVSNPTATGLTTGGTYSETQFIRINFAAAGSVSASSQIVPPTTAVPEPASMALLGAGLFGLGMVRRRRSRQG